MAADLVEIFERLQWAETEIERLANEVEVYFQHAFRLYLERNPLPNGDKIVMVHRTVQLPTAIKARTGSIVNEVRSCLDALASVLAIRNGRTPKSVFFPITDTEEDFYNKNKGAEKIRKLSENDKAVVAALRPWKTSVDGSYGNVLLWGLHKADVQRKHQNLVEKITAGSMGIGNGYIESIDYFNPNIEDEPVPFARLSARTTCSLSIIPRILYDAPDVLRGREIIGVLNEFRALTQSIVQRFA